MPKDCRACFEPQHCDCLCATCVASKARMKMCEISPKHKRFFRLEFFTSQEMTPGKWESLVMERLVELEQEFNKSGAIRVHIHEAEE